MRIKTLVLLGPVLLVGTLASLASEPAPPALAGTAGPEVTPAECASETASQTEAPLFAEASFSQIITQCGSCSTGGCAGLQSGTVCGSVGQLIATCRSAEFQLCPNENAWKCSCSAGPIY